MHKTYLPSWKWCHNQLCAWQPHLLKKGEQDTCRVTPKHDLKAKWLMLPQVKSPRKLKTMRSETPLSLSWQQMTRHPSHRLTSVIEGEKLIASRAEVPQLTTPMPLRRGASLRIILLDDGRESEMGRVSWGQCPHWGAFDNPQSSKYSSPSYKSLRKTTVENMTVIARLQIQADKAARYITCTDNTNESARQKLNMAKKALSDIITLLDDT